MVWKICESGIIPKQSSKDNDFHYHWEKGTPTMYAHVQETDLQWKFAEPTFNVMSTIIIQSVSQTTAIHNINRISRLIPYRHKSVVPTLIYAVSSLHHI